LITYRTYQDQARNLRKNKTKEATTTPEAAYESLLRGEVKSTRTQWDEFRRKWKKDRRFYAYGRDDKEREKKFRAWLVELGESKSLYIVPHNARLIAYIVKRREAKKAEDDFAELLKTVDGVTKDSEWKDVRTYRQPMGDHVLTTSCRSNVASPKTPGTMLLDLPADEKSCSTSSSRV
jgi:hypothetical protein